MSEDFDAPLEDGATTYSPVRVLLDTDSFLWFITDDPE